MSLTPDMLLQYGVLGVVLAWFMFRMEKKIEALTEAIDDLKDVIRNLATT